MNKKVSLKEIVGTKIVYAIILTSYYWMWARTDWKGWYETAQYVLGVFLFSFFVVQMIRISKYKKEGIDEMAEHNLKRCDSICLDRKSTRLNSSHLKLSRMPSSA